jgi:hypothetical protein
MKVVWNQWKNLSLWMRLKNRTKKIKNKNMYEQILIMSKIIQLCHNNLLKLMFYLETWMLKLDVSYINCRLHKM